MNRKTFLATIISGICIWLLTPAHKVRSIFNRLKKSPCPNEHELKTASRIAEYIYPEDDSPGSVSLGIYNFFTVQFKTSYYQEFIPSIKRLTKYLDSECRKDHGKDFLSSGAMSQNKLLDSIAFEKKNQTNNSAKKDLHTLIDLTLEGCFSDPMHGGNRNKQAWKSLGGSIKEDWFYA